MLRHLYLAAGFACVGLAFVGAVLPIMPSTVFVILAAGCFARSSPRFEAWLMNHPQFGPSLTAWRVHGAIPPRAKALAVMGMALGYGLFWASVDPGPGLAIAVAALIGASAVFVLTRPSGPTGP
ncbi:MAG: YbaN family protein [Pseudomonadota bacterium]